MDRKRKDVVEKVMKHEDYRDTNCSWCDSNCPQKFRKEIRGNGDQMKIRVLLESARILRKLLEETCCRLDLSEKLPVKTGVKKLASSNNNNNNNNNINNNNLGRSYFPLSFPFHLFLPFPACSLSQFYFSQFLLVIHVLSKCYTYVVNSISFQTFL